jgi:hypothetical protein
MISNKLWKTAQTPSRFVMPISGATFGTGTDMVPAAAVCSAPTYVERDRHVAGNAVFSALTLAVRPGSTAWSPPTC